MTSTKKRTAAALTATIFAAVLAVPAMAAKALVIGVSSYKGNTLEVGERSGLIIGPSGVEYTVTSSDPDTAAVEQVMEGSLSSLGDPKMSLAGMAVLPDNEFAILYTNGKDVPVCVSSGYSDHTGSAGQYLQSDRKLCGPSGGQPVPEQHPEAYVRYEIGLDTGSGMTSEDAIKNLNTRIMSGSGPDLLVLDGLPARSFGKKECWRI